MPNRREFLAGTLGGLACAPAAWSRGSINGQGLDEKSLITVILRGGADTLAIIPPVGDPDFVRHRTLRTSELFSLPAPFSLHASLPFIHQCHLRKQLAIVPAVALPYRGRSHFEAQQMLDSGGKRPYHQATGWLARALGRDHPTFASTVVVPLPLQGGTRVLTANRHRIGRVPDELFDPLRSLYKDSWLSDELSGALRQHARQPRDESPFAATGRAIAMGDANIACVELGGFDTHQNQIPILARRLMALNEGLVDLYRAMGRQRWEKTVVLVYSEFGRRVTMNATSGTDHGTAGVLFALGGAVKSGVIGTWPGLSPDQLLDKRDLRPTVDIRDIFAAALHQHAGLTEDDAQSIFGHRYQRIGRLVR